MSPDAEEALLDFDSDSSFVIGGLIDRTVVKGASLSQANAHSIKARRLPIAEFCGEALTKQALSIN
jgi:tRNA (guanine9-N1)-methyltransferase